MIDTTINCPGCGTEIRISEALATRIRADVEAALRAEAADELQTAVAEAEARTRSELQLDLRDMKARLEEQSRKAVEAQRRELELRKQARVLEARALDLDLELERRLAEERQKIETTLRRHANEEHALKLKEKDKQIEDLKRLLDEARRRSEQGSQELQGEVLELDVEAVLASRFPLDEIKSVPKGTRGADLVQAVRTDALEPCGAIIWEIKNTKRWSAGWIEKLKADQRETGASLAVLVSVALPDDIHGFALIDGVWVTSMESYLALATALREQLIHVSFARGASSGMGEKMDLLYRYLSGEQFRHRVEAIVEAFNAMQAQLAKERRAMERLWAEREKQIERVTLGTVRMYGDIRGIVGTTMPAIEALELDEMQLLEENVE